MANKGGFPKPKTGKEEEVFKFYRLGSSIFGSDGQINPDVKFDTLASHIWFSETGRPWTKRNVSPLIGTKDKAAIIYFSMVFWEIRQLMAGTF
jgi:hypothetical protein